MMKFQQHSCVLSAAAMADALFWMTGSRYAGHNFVPSVVLTRFDSLFLGIKELIRTDSIPETDKK